MNMRYETHPILNNRDFMYQKYIIEDLSDREIGELLHCPPHQVRLARRRLGIASRPRGHNLKRGNGGVDNYMLRPGAVSPFAGHRHTAQACEAISRAASRPRVYLRGNGNGMYGRREEKSTNWKGGLSPFRQRVYGTAEWAEFRRKVCERDGHKCRRCGESTTRKRGMHVHHIKPVEQYPELIMDMDNAALLCKKCHDWVEGKENVNREWLA